MSHTIDHPEHLELQTVFKTPAVVYLVTYINAMAAILIHGSSICLWNNNGIDTSLINLNKLTYVQTEPVYSVPTWREKQTFDLNTCVSSRNVRYFSKKLN